MLRTERAPVATQEVHVNIGRPKRIIEVEPASLPLPETLQPIPETAPAPETVPETLPVEPTSP